MEVIERSSMKPKIDIKDASAVNDFDAGKPQPPPSDINQTEASEEFAKLLKGL